MSPAGVPVARVARALPGLVAVSGAAALVYESLWMRSFGLVFGSTNAAVAVVLAVFMGGLALGSALAARRPARDALATYARLELATGAAALVSLPLLRALPSAYGALAGVAGLSPAAEAAGRCLLAAVVLLPATTLLGATVPVALAFLERAGADVRRGFGRLYLLNTLGGALGVALAGFLLVPSLGLRATLVVAAAASLCVGGLALRWSREIGPPDGPAREAETTIDVRGNGRLGPMLAAASGLASFGVEVLWTRSLALVIGSSVYAFHLMLLAVLLGIAIGTLGYGSLAARRSAAPGPGPAAAAVGWLFVAAGGLMLAGQWLIGRLPSAWLAILGVLPVSFAAQQLAALALCVLALLPVTAALGFTFPLLLHLVGAADGRGQRAAGRLYAWNTAGAIAGALSAHLLLVPRLGLQPPYLVFASVLIVAGACALLLGRGVRPLAVTGVGLVVALALLAAVPGWKPWDPVLASSGVYRYGLQWHEALVPAAGLGDWLRAQRSLLFYREGAEAVVAVSEPRGSHRRFLSVNGKTDAGSGVEDVVTQKLIAHVPLLLHRSPRRALVVGWGAGATAASAALHPLESLECVEIEKATWEATRFFPDLGGRVKDDPRFRIVFADARSHLLRSRELFDVVVSEPSNPWISGVSNLFTREFYEIVLGRLAPAGVFGQWFHYYDLEPQDLKVELKTFLSVFPQASLWLVPPTASADGSRQLGADLLLVGSREPQPIDWPRLERAFADPRVGPDLRSTRVLGDAAALAAAWAMGREEMARWAEDRAAFPSGTPLNTDDYPYVEVVAPRRNVARPADAARAAAAQYEALSRAAGDVASRIVGEPTLAAGGRIASVFLDRLAERYARAGQPERAIATYSAALVRDPRDAAAHARVGELLLERGRPAEAQPHLEEAVRSDPAQARAWEALGEIALDRRDYARAEEAQRALLRLEPANVAAWLHLGAALARQSRWDGALDALETARSIDVHAPVDPELLAYARKQARGQAPPR
jgi:spermidine synthase